MDVLCAQAMSNEYLVPFDGMDEDGFYIYHDTVFIFKLLQQFLISLVICCALKHAPLDMIFKVLRVSSLWTHHQPDQDTLRDRYSHTNSS